MGYGSYEQFEEKVFSMLNEGNFSEALSMVQERHERGDSDATCVLASMYLFGTVVIEDTDKAIELYEAALNSGNPQAAQMLGSLFENGDERKCISANPEKAFRYYQRGADLGHPASFGCLAQCYYWGTGTPEDNSKAFSCGIQAAKQGDLNGMIVVALCYDDGLGTPRDPNAAAHWYREIIQVDDRPQFMYRLSVCLADPFSTFNIRPTQDMLEESFYWASKGVEAGHIESHIIIAWFYETGNVVGVDYETSHRFLTLAAETGNEFAQDLLKRYRKNIRGDIYLPQ